MKTMREIKFRQWINNKFHYWGYHGQDSFIGPVTPVIGSQQFTGLQDRNGRDIYEGDIVTHFNGVNVVEWFDDNASFQMNLNDNVFDQELSFDSQEVEVIGNVYEHPELLNEK